MNVSTFDEGLRFLKILNPALKIHKLLTEVLWTECKEIPDADFITAVRRIGKTEKTLFVDNDGRPRVNLLALIWEHVPAKKTALSSTMLTEFRSKNDFEFGKGEITKLIASLNGRTVAESGPTNSKRKLLGQMRKLKLKERRCQS